MAETRYKKYSDWVRAALLLARENHSVGEIAKAIGCSRASVSSLLNGGRLGTPILKKCEAWARDQGYWLWDGLIEPGSFPADMGRKGEWPPYPAELIREAKEKYPTADAYWRGLAQELQTVIDTISSPAFDDITKFTRVETTITFLARALASAKEAVEKDKRGDF